MASEEAANATSAAAAAAAAAATAAAATLHAYADLSGKFDRGTDKIYDKVTHVDEKVTVLAQNFAVHKEAAKREQERIDAHEEALHGKDGVVKKVEHLWAIDQVKVWAIRGLTGTALFVLGYGVKHWMGW